MLHEVLTQRLLENPRSWGWVLALVLIWMVVTVVPRGRSMVQAEIQLATALLDLHDSRPEAGGYCLNPEVPLKAAQSLFRFSYGWLGWLQVLIAAMVLAGSAFLIILTIAAVVLGATREWPGIVLALLVSLWFIGWSILQIRAAHKFLGLGGREDDNPLNMTLQEGVRRLRAPTDEEANDELPGEDAF